MREIQFRAWYKHKKQMISGPMAFLGGAGNDGWVLITAWIEGMDCSSAVYGRPEFEIMQFTGLKDKHGKDVYEGDLLEARDYWGEGDYAEVAWNAEQLQWYLKRNGAYYEPLRSPFADGAMVFVIVGNIYEGVLP